MDAEKELLESLEFVSEIERDILGSHSTIDDYVAKLEKDIQDLTRDEKASSSDRGSRIALLAKLCALSELYSVTDFDRMIEARELFVDLLPEHFHSYLNYLETSTISSNLLYGCLGCQSFKGVCELGLKPPVESHGEHCQSRTAYATC